MTELELLEQIDKKLDKLLTRTLKISKVLHLVPVTEKEEKEIQVLQRNNMAAAVKINNELDAIQNKVDDSAYLGINNILEESQSEVYEDIIGSEFIQPREGN